MTTLFRTRRLRRWILRVGLGLAAVVAVVVCLPGEQVIAALLASDEYVAKTS